MGEEEYRTAHTPVVNTVRKLTWLLVKCTWVRIQCTQAKCSLDNGMAEVLNIACEIKVTASKAKRTKKKKQTKQTFADHSTDTARTERLSCKVKRHELPSLWEIWLLMTFCLTLVVRSALFATSNHALTKQDMFRKLGNWLCVRLFVIYEIRLPSHMRHMDRERTSFFNFNCRGTMSVFLLVNANVSEIWFNPPWTWQNYTIAGLDTVRELLQKPEMLRWSPFVWRCTDIFKITVLLFR